MWCNPVLTWFVLEVRHVRMMNMPGGPEFRDGEAPVSGGPSGPARPADP